MLTPFTSRGEQPMVCTPYEFTRVFVCLVGCPLPFTSSGHLARVPIVVGTRYLRDATQVLEVPTVEGGVVHLDTGGVVVVLPCQDREVPRVEDCSM